MRLTTVFLLTFLGVSCGSSSSSSDGPSNLSSGAPSNLSSGVPSNPAGPSNTGSQSAGVCRTFASRSTQVTTASGFSATSDTTCSFNVATVESTCTSQYRDSTGTMSTTTAVTRFRSVADAVDEVRVVPPLMKNLSTVTTQSPGGTTTVTNTFDGQGRITQMVSTAPFTTLTPRGTAPAGRRWGSTSDRGSITPERCDMTTRRGPKGQPQPISPRSKHSMRTEI
jgi:hypothetical protein